MPPEPFLPRPLASRRWFAPLCVVLVGWGLITHGKYSVSGDEPHYLMVSRSLWLDGDFDVRNNYAAGDAFGEGEIEHGPHARETRTGALHSVHDLGLPVLMTPVYGVTTTLTARAPQWLLDRARMTPGLLAYSLMSLVLIALSAWAADLTRSALLAEGASAARATAIVLVAWLSIPLLSNSFVVFPEVIVLVVSAAAVRVWTRSPADLSPRVVVLLASAIGVLPWLHRKFLVFAAAMLAVVAWRHRQVIRGWPRTTQGGLALAIAAPSIVLAWWTWHHWGNLAGPLVGDRAPFSWQTLRVGALGLLVDRENGLAVWSPVYLLLPAFWVLAKPRVRPWLLPVLAVWLLSAAHDQWWAGFSPVGRFLVPLVPMGAIVAATALDSAILRRAAAVLLVPQIVITAYAWQHTRALWPQGDGINRVIEPLFGWAGVHALLPSLRSAEPQLGAAIVLSLAVLAANAAVVFAAGRWERRRR